MLKIGENIHIISPRVKAAIAERDGGFFVDLARRQKAAGADVLDLNIGPQKKAGPEVMDWLVDCVQEAVPGMTLSFDTTNLAAIEVGLKKVGANAIINSTSAEEERLGQRASAGGPVRRRLDRFVSGEERHPRQRRRRASGSPWRSSSRAPRRSGVAMEKLFIDPLILTVSGCQEYVPHAIETVRMLKMVADPPPLTVVGLSNVSNQVPAEMRPAAQSRVPGDVDGRRPRRRHPRSARPGPDGRSDRRAGP